MKTITEKQLQISALLGAVKSLHFIRYGKGWSVSVVLAKLDEKAALVTQKKTLRVWKSLDRAMKHVTKFYAPASGLLLEIRL